MAWYRKFYKCPDGHEWEDEWDCLCDDRCPVCNTSCEPYDHEVLEEDSEEEKTIKDALLYGTGAIMLNYPLQAMNIPFIMLIRKDYTNEPSPLHFPDGCVDLRDLHSGSQSLDSGTRDEGSADD